MMNDSDDDYQDMDGKKKYANDEERTKDKYGDAASEHSLKDDPKMLDGMNRKERKCQDIICLIIFIAYVGAMGFITVYGFMNGDITKLLAPIDGDNHFCGIKNDDGHDLTEYPNLYIGNLEVLTAQAAFENGVCVKKCPKSHGGAQSAVIGGECKVGTKLCTGAQWQYSSESIAGLCFPIGGEKALHGKTVIAAWKLVAGELKNSAGGKVVSDIMKAQTPIYVCIGTGFIFALILLYLMSEFAEAIAWVCIFLTGIGLFAGSVLCWFMRSDITTEMGVAGSGKAFQGHDQTDSETEKFWLLVGAILLAILGCCFLVCVICGYKHVKEAIDVIDAAADFTVENKRVIIVPIVYFIFTLISFLLWLYAFACVVSLNKISADSGIIPQDRIVHWTSGWTACALGMFFGILWIMAWWNYTSQFVVMAAATTYYFNCTEETEYEGQADLCYSVKLAHVYHTGSIAAGAFIIAVIEFIKFVFLYLAKKAEKASGGNKCIKAVVCVAECCLSCIEKVCDYINQAAFAYIAVTGDGFCEGAWKGFLLNVKHMLSFTFANYIAKIFILLGKVCICVVNGFTLVFILKDVSGLADQIHIWGPVGVSTLITYVIAALFLGIFENAVLALMTCLAVDIDLNGDDGEPKWGPRTFHDKITKIKNGAATVDEESEMSGMDTKKASKMK